MSIIAVVCEKGGTGKTTIATNLAAMRTKAGKDVLLVDTDIQGSASNWCLSRDDHEVKPRIASVQKFGKGLRQEVEALSNKCDDIIIDAGGRDTAEFRGSLLVADKAIMPLRASQFDLWALVRIHDVISAIKDVNPKLQASVLINLSSTNPSVKETEQAKEFFQDLEHVNLLNTIICDRIAFRRAAIYGMSVVELEPQDTKAITEITNLYQEIFNA
jgi:chromosome partitioning protein